MVARKTEFFCESAGKSMTCVIMWKSLRYTVLLRSWNGPYVELLDHYVRKLDERLLFHSVIHGKGHILRTMILAAKVGETLRLSQKDMALVLLAASYHDIGRFDDSYDVGHGARSAERWPGDMTLSLEEDGLIRGMMAAHSQPDRMLAVILEQYVERVGERELQLAKLLKDADGLDRVRINYLDPTFLRFEESLDHILFAEELCRLTKNASFFSEATLCVRLSASLV